ncbi:MAG: hypothetical protein AABY83_08235 [Pseudomonadota bacterium]
MQTGMVVVGIGEIGAVIAHGFMRLGLPVYPVVRGMDMQQCARAWPLPQAVVIATGEAELSQVLRDMPVIWRDRAVLLQNELLPRDWLTSNLTNPTVISIWFEKKRGQDVKVLLSSPAYGPHGACLVRCLNSVNIPAHTVADERAMLFELVRKNVYILTINIAGLECGGDVAGLWTHHRALAERVAHEVMDVQDYLTGHPFERAKLMLGLAEGIQGDPKHLCLGRSAPMRLTRLLEHAQTAGLAVPTLRRIFAQYVNARVNEVVKS